MSSIVVDASAILALALDEPGSEIVRDSLAAGASISAVNLAEVLGRLVDLGGTVDVAESLVLQLNPEVVDFSQDHARTVAGLRNLTRQAGLSLGDRACFALARELGVPVLTADRAWAGLDLGVEVRLIR